MEICGGSFENKQKHSSYSSLASLVYISTRSLDRFSHIQYLFIYFLAFTCIKDISMASISPSGLRADNLDNDIGASQGCPFPSWSFYLQCIYIDASGIELLIYVSV